MFFSSEGPAEPHCTELAALHRSMNAPVVALEQLPVGPARAAVALYRDSGDGVTVSVAVRCTRTGGVAHFTAGDELRELRSSEIALDAALSFCESMGFLFDDEEVAIRGPRDAARIWRRFIGAEDGEREGFGESPLDSAIELTELDPGSPRSSFQRSDEFEAALDGEGGPAGGTGIEEAPGPNLSSVARSSAEKDSKETPFWLSIPEEDLPRQVVRTSAAPLARPANSPELSSPPHFVLPAQTPEAAHPDPDECSDAALSVMPETRELLLDALAETAVDRVFPVEPSGCSLSKFRWQSAASTSPVRASSARHEEKEAERDGANSAGPNLRLRLLSRF